MPSWPSLLRRAAIPQVKTTLCKEIISSLWGAVSDKCRNLGAGRRVGLSEFLPLLPVKLLVSLPPLALVLPLLPQSVRNTLQERKVGIEQERKN